MMNLKNLIISLLVFILLAFKLNAQSSYVFIKIYNAQGDYYTKNYNYKVVNNRDTLLVGTYKTSFIAFTGAFLHFKNLNKCIGDIFIYFDDWEKIRISPYLLKKNKYLHIVWGSYKINDLQLSAPRKIPSKHIKLQNTEVIDFNKKNK